MDSLERKVLAGDHEAFKEWMNIHIQNVEWFAVQYGLTPQDAGKVAETVFRNLYNDLGQLTLEQLEEKALFKFALKNLSGFQVEASETILFSFEEDNELYAHLVGLPKEERIIFILSHFQQKSIEAIARITETPLEHVEDLLQNARAKLDGPDIEKRLEFLATSIDRLRPSYNERNIFYSKPKEALPVDETVKKASRPKKPLLLWLVGSVMLILILSVTVLRSETYQLASDKRFIEKLNNSFQQELDNRFDLIGLSVPEKGNASYTVIFQGYRSAVSPVTYGYDTKYKYKRVIRELERQMDEGGRLNRIEAKQKYENLVFELRLPSEMVEQLQKNPLTDERELSLVFLNELAIKNGFLVNGYYQILSENAEMILMSDLFRDGTVNIDKLLEQKASFPTELQNAIEGMATQYFSLTSIKDIDPLTTKYGTPELEDVLRKNLHPDMQIYISLLMGAFDIVYTGTFEEHLEALLELEDALPKIKESGPMVDSFYSTYIFMFITAAGFNNEKGIFDASGVVREEIKENWRRIASNGESSPTGQIMKRLINEIVVSNWKSSSYYEELMEYGVWVELDKKINALKDGMSVH